MDESTVEIIRVLDMLQENNEPCSLDGIYASSHYTFKHDLEYDLGELVDNGILAVQADGTYTRALDLVKAAMEERARQEVEAIRANHGYGNGNWDDWSSSLSTFYSGVEA